MAHLTERPTLPLWSDQLRFVRAHVLLLSSLGVVGLLLGLALSATQPTSYAATSSVVLPRVPKYVLPTGEGVLPPQVSIDTDAQLLHSPVVLRRVGAALGTGSATVMDHLSVTATANSDALHVTATAASPELAAAAANAAVGALAQVRRDTLGSLRLDQLRLLRLWTTDQESVLAQAQGVGAIIPASDELFARVVDLRTSLRELEEARALPVQVVDAAVPPQRPVRANIEVPLVSGLMLGALAGCLIGAGLDRRNVATSTHSSRRATARPSLALRLTPPTTSG